MKWGQRKQKKYAEKANRQAKANKKEAKNLKKILDSNYDSTSGSKLSKQDRKYYRHQYNRSVKSGKEWMKTREDILSMDLSKVNTKDIKKRYKSTKASYYPFA